MPGLMWTTKQLPWDHKWVGRLPRWIWHEASILTNFYRCTIKGLLMGYITVWCENCSTHSRKSLQRVVKVAQRITGNCHSRHLQLDTPAAGTQHHEGPQPSSTQTVLLLTVWKTIKEHGCMYLQTQGQLLPSSHQASKLIKLIPIRTPGIWPHKLLLISKLDRS